MSLFLNTFAILAAAQSGSDGARRIVDDLFACRAIEAPAERLACFDRAVAAVSAARESKEIVIVDQATVKRTRRSLFGFSLPRINLFGGEKDGPDEGAEMKEIDATITAATQRRDGAWQVTLDDGSLWYFTEPMVTTPRAGDAIRIKRAALGSFFGSVRGKIGVRIRRER